MVEFSIIANLSVIAKVYNSSAKSGLDSFYCGLWIEGLGNLWPFRVYKRATPRSVFPQGAEFAYTISTVPMMFFNAPLTNSRTMHQSAFFSVSVM